MTGCVNFFKSIYGSQFSKMVTYETEKDGKHNFSNDGKKAVAKWLKEKMTLPLKLNYKKIKK